jgi:hypothetical protein
MKHNLIDIAIKAHNYGYKKRKINQFLNYSLENIDKTPTPSEFQDYCKGWSNEQVNEYFSTLRTKPN